LLLECVSPRDLNVDHGGACFGGARALQGSQAE
jgi:hypothetical protein